MSTLALPARKPWRLPTFLWLSIALHAAALVLALLHTPWWPWALAAVVANHGAITFSGLWPRSRWLGDNVTRLPAANAARGEWALTLDDGPDPEVTPQVLDILDAHGAKATFFCIAANVQRHPQLAALIVAKGHSMQNHSAVHAHSFSLWGTRRIEADLSHAQHTLLAVTGHTPRYFRAPAGLRNIFLAPVLHRLGLRLVSWTRRGFDTREARAPLVLARLQAALHGGSILLLHDGNSARNAQGRAVILDVLPLLLNAASAQGLRCVTLPEALG